MDWLLELSSGAIRVFCFCLAALLLLAVLHKVRLLRTGAAATQPLLALTPWREQHANVLVVSAACVELLSGVALVVTPVLGLAATIAVLAVYTAELWRLDRNQDCGCFGDVLSASRNDAIRRNTILLTLAGASLVSAATGFAPVGDISQATVGAALMAVAALVAASAAIGAGRRAGVAADVTSRKGGGWLAS